MQSDILKFASPNPPMHITCLMLLLPIFNNNPTIEQCTYLIVMLSENAFSPRISSNAKIRMVLHKALFSKTAPRICTKAAYG